MKQGRAGRDVMESTKREPRSHAVSLDTVANMGQKYIFTKQPPGLYKSDGYRAPMAGSHIHPSGSQGKNK